MCKRYDEGGLAMIDIESYIAALKVSWIKRQITSSHTWNILFEHVIAQGNFLWNRNARSLRKYAGSTKNVFWKETIVAYAEFTTTVFIDNDDIGRCSIWYSNETKFKEEEQKQWRRRGLHNINDVLGLTGNLLTLEQFNEKFQLHISYLEFFGLFQSFPRTWRMSRNKIKHLEPVVHPYVQCVLDCSRGTKAYYNRLVMQKYRLATNSWENYWETALGDIDWAEIYSDLYTDISSVQLQMLQYKILSKIIATNTLLHRIGIKDNDRCTRCNLGRDTVIHKFWECEHVKLFWTRIGEWVNGVQGIERVYLDRKTVILGLGHSKLVKHIIIIGKSMINFNAVLNIDHLIARLKIEMITEETIAKRNNKMDRYNNKWAVIRTMLC